MPTKQLGRCIHNIDMLDKATINILVMTEDDRNTFKMLQGMAHILKHILQFQLKIETNGL